MASFVAIRQSHLTCHLFNCFVLFIFLLLYRLFPLNGTSFHSTALARANRETGKISKYLYYFKGHATYFYFITLNIFKLFNTKLDIHFDRTRFLRIPCSVMSLKHETLDKPMHISQSMMIIFFLVNLYQLSQHHPNSFKSP